ncbi:hypothetical protein PIB30_061068 [Stylosanthes scabra]|uniref:COMM domain-containing protein n=1 Tax=Stylosanthes scabra TaxID=79078 RepID=A0ABU6YJE2_9FABA|nr:hypothetical protein [Stylosanthes scabra]
MANEDRLENPNLAIENQFSQNNIQALMKFPNQLSRLQNLQNLQSTQWTLQVRTHAAQATITLDTEEKGSLDEVEVIKELLQKAWIAATLQAAITTSAGNEMDDSNDELQDSTQKGEHRPHPSPPQTPSPSPFLRDSADAITHQAPSLSCLHLRFAESTRKGETSSLLEDLRRLVPLVTTVVSRAAR